MLPDVAVTVTFDMPAGVGFALDEFEQPTIKPVEITKPAITPKTRSPINCLRRRPASIDPNGISNARRIPGARNWLKFGRCNSPYVACVASVNVVVAGAFGETASEVEPKVHDVPRGSPLQLNVTVPVKELLGAMLSASAVDAGTPTDATVEDVLRLNVGVLVAVVALAIKPNNPCVSCASPAVKYKADALPFALGNISQSPG